jgi:hypothetical protein
VKLYKTSGKPLETKYPHNHNRVGRGAIGWKHRKYFQQNNTRKFPKSWKIYQHSGTWGT